MKRLRAQAGVALVTAIFLLVVLAGLALAVVSLTTGQQAGSTLDLQGERAYQAAKSGMDWALYTALQTNQASGLVAGGGLGCPKTTTFAMPLGTTLSAYTVTVVCSAPVVGTGATDTAIGHFQITVTACNGPAGVACPNAAPGPDYVQRVISAQL